MTKYCSRCRINKELREFYNNNNHKDGKTFECKECMDASRKERTRTRNGLATVLYCSQRANSKRRGDNMPSYTKVDFKCWLFSQPNFDVMYNNWVMSGYKREMKPSADRHSKDNDYDYLPYSLDRLRLTTAGVNLRKSHKDRKNGVNNKFNKSVKQFTKAGVFIKEYHSMRQAERETKISQSTISLVCAGKLKSTGGFRWKSS